MTDEHSREPAGHGDRASASGAPEASGTTPFSWVEAEKDLMEGIDTTVPHSARIWNYWLGGKDNYPVDREAGDQFVKAFPGIVAEARANRQFLARAIHYLVTEADIH